jgi:1-pyrroline-5-carboxylate dehydrogenase
MTVEPFRNQPIETFTGEEARREMREALRRVREEFGRHWPLYIGGAWVDTGERILSLNPSAPSEVVGTVAKAGKAEAEAALEAAWRAYRTWKDWPQEDRSRLLLKAAAIMKRRRRELEATLVYEIGKNWVEASAEVAEAIDFLEYYARQALKYKYPSVEVVPYPGEDNESFYLPLGAGVVIAPWNFPIAIFTGMIAGPVAVGNTVVAKPAEDTPVIAAKVFEIFHEAGFPPGVVNLVPGEGKEVGAYLVEHPRTRFINFTGSLEVGLWINQAASRLAPGQRWIKRVFLELGGKDAIIVDETADFDLAAEGILVSAYGFQGRSARPQAASSSRKGLTSPFWSGFWSGPGASPWARRRRTPTWAPWPPRPRRRRSSPTLRSARGREGSSWGASAWRARATSSPPRSSPRCPPRPGSPRRRSSARSSP